MQEKWNRKLGEKKPAILRFVEKVEFTDEHWFWTASLNGDGYGTFWDGEKVTRAHQWSHWYFIGPVSGEVDHLCRIRNCVRPECLQDVPHHTNVMLGLGGQNSRDKTHCPQGHPYDEANTLYWKKGNRRICRACRAERFKATYVPLQLQ